MRRISSARIFPIQRGRVNWHPVAPSLIVLAVLLALVWARPVWGKNSDFIIESWQDHEGIPESSVRAAAQSPDGYLWVGTPEGLLRFDGVNFTKAENFSDLIRLTGSVTFLQADRSGRLWADTETGLALYDQGVWQRVQGTNFLVRSVAVDRHGLVLLGGFEGQLGTVNHSQVEKFPPPAGLKPSGVFCLTDALDGRLWLANKGFIGRLNGTNWERLGPAQPVANALLAAPAQTGGIWVYIPGELRRYAADGTVKSFPAPDLDQPREMIEDRAGNIWIASVARGLIRLRPGGESYAFNATNGLSHDGVRCVFEDLEGNIWAGGSLNGLNRLKLRQFITLGRADGLPDNIARTVVEVSPGQIIVGTHGGGMARIHDGKITAEAPLGPEARGQYVWSLAPSRTGRLWIGTYNDGLFFQTNGVSVHFDLPPEMGKSIARLLEDARGRLWVGGAAGLAVIETNSHVTSFNNSAVAGFAITSLVEDTNAGAIWIGTYAHGVFRMDSQNFTNITKLDGLPADRVSSLTLDNDDYLWVGIFEHGLASVHDGKTTLIGPPQGLPAETVGSILDDGRGFFWLGTTRGILRVSCDALHRVAQTPTSPAVFNLFNVSDGLASEYCVEGYQPNALRDRAGHLWFGTDRGLVTVDPGQLRLNTNPPPVKIERAGFTDRAGTNHVSFKPAAGELIIPAGSAELEFYFTALSFTAPEKMSFAYRLAGVNKNWVNIGNLRVLHFREMAPGHYVLHIKAANNDGLWNENGATLAFTIKPFFWKTAWFRLLILIAVAVVVWRITRRQFQQRIEHLQQQRRLEQERARLATVMENTSDLVVFADAAGGVIHINPAGRKLIGLPAEEKSSALTLAQLQPAWAMDRVVREGIPAARAQGTWEGETALLHRDGHEIPVSQVIIAHKDSAGQDNFLSTIARDITGRKHAEAELQRREKYFRSLIENASDSITVINSQGRVTFQSSSGERILGYPAETITGRSLLELVHPDDLAKAQTGLKQALTQLNVPVTLTVRLQHVNGSWRTIEAVGTGLQNEAGETQIIVNSRDLTDNIKLEEQFRQAQKMEAVGRLSGGVAHDFNNILTVIQGNVDFLKYSDKLSPAEREALGDIAQGTERAAALTRQLLAFSRRQTMQTASLDLNQIVVQMTRMLRRILGEDIEMHLTYSAQPVFVRADAGMLEQVLLNLVVNSRDAMPAGGRLVIETAVAEIDRAAVLQHPQWREGTFVCLSVRDTGYGIPADLLPRIFEPFFTTKDVGKGTGLGLATVYGIVEQHNGWVAVDSESGKGTTFRIYLPRLALADAPGTAVPKSAAVPGGKETILLVEDEPSLRTLAGKYLARLGYKIIEAGSGVEALKLWSQHKSEIALVLTDLVMPGGVSGRELAQTLRREQPGVKIIYTSGYSADIAGKDFPLQEGVNFLPKPFNPADLARLVRKALDEPVRDEENKL
jgi:PAS domain S-box-containing protein